MGRLHRSLCQVCGQGKAAPSGHTLFLFIFSGTPPPPAARAMPLSGQW